MRLLLLAALLALPAPPARAGFGAAEAGTSGAEFLKLASDARAAGMGRAVRAAVDDASAAWWNPAGLAGLQYRHASLTHAASFQSGFVDTLAFGMPVKGPSRGSRRERDLEPDQIGSIAVSAVYHDAGRLAEIDNTGTATGGSVAPRDLAVGVSWGATMTRSVDAGVTVRYISTKIVRSAATGALDAGLRWRGFLPGDTPWSVAGTVRNAGGKLKFNEASDPLPLEFAAATAIRPLKGVIISFDLVAPRDRGLYPCLGFEWRAPLSSGMAGALRAGYDGRLRPGDVGTLAGPTFGAGLVLQRLTFDYAWAPAGFLGDSHLMTGSFRF
ncbi:MAG: PorV/PorQ family protein [Elusimicrobiota bacterium]|nr:PorV/PorQ family protein [Elusimicrobiota bacterium]